ncbi:hypothetical protein [Flavobacterium hydrophilum]|uniref:Uncharacterized protein n=1 Tax=Flavobacterium hydrophilum TaxID=2211445 RepID=A0A2V4C0X8_9FLAO|nr:hypothetical protein [Flavobacterium hydrophilum]PXY44522.1 hypothetical protein DMB68_13725 [Flavobacterium hydrophilum]
MSNEKAVDYFDRHPSSNECHITSDNRVFHTKGTADGHAGGLKDNEVISHYRSDFELMNKKVIDPVIETGETTEDKEARFKKRVDTLILLGFARIDDNFIRTSDNTTISISTTDVLESNDEEFNVSIIKNPINIVVENADAPKADHLELLKNFDPKTAIYPEVLSLFNSLGLTAPTKKQPDLLAAIEAYKVAVNLEDKQ